MMQYIKFLIVDVEPSMITFMLMITLPIVIGYVLFYLGTIGNEDGNSLKGLRTFAFLPLIAGALIGLPYFLQALDPIYVDAYFLGKKGVMLHYAVFFVPLVGLIGLLFWSKAVNNTKDVF